jgi:hypothetical protein
MNTVLSLQKLYAADDDGSCAALTSAISNHCGPCSPN